MPATWENKNYFSSMGARGTQQLTCDDPLEGEIPVEHEDGAKAEGLLLSVTDGRSPTGC